MLNKLLHTVRRYQMLAPGDRVVCAVSGGADSVALLFALYLLREKLGIILSAAHFNHGLRGEESDRDEAFVRDLCDRFSIPLSVGRGQVTAGEKGLEAAAREARYAWFATLPGKLATAHTADDNGETVLLNMIRGTGLKGLGGIAPVRGNVIRPMLDVTRQQVLAFLDEYHMPFIHDSTNDSDDFTRNRLRHHVMPLLRAENPRISQSLSAMAQSLREEEKALSWQAEKTPVPEVSRLRGMEPARRHRYLAAFLKQCGVREPERAHIHGVEKIVFSQNPSARIHLPGGVTVCRNYDRLERCEAERTLEEMTLKYGGTVELPQLGISISCRPAGASVPKKDRFTVLPQGKVVIRSRMPGDTMRLSGGTKSLKKLFIDRKIPAHLRMQIPVIADGAGVLGVWGIGANLDRLATDGQGVEIVFTQIERCPQGGE